MASRKRSIPQLRGVAPGEKPLSELLDEALASDGPHPVRVGDVADRLDERGFGFLLILLALPTLIPILPPGASGVVGILYVLVGAQMMWAPERPWLPRRVADYRLSVRVVEGLRRQGVGLLRRMERLSRPRWTPFSDAVLLRVAAVVVLAMGFVLWLPLPFLNTLPGISMIVVGIGLMNRDGIFLLLGIGLAAVVASLIGLGVEALRGFMRWLLSLLPS
ncbi:MAG: exopolysaccharide biosynthesis protein [Armatimonadota bacterium]|nr:exopolysaccharide biosynthesis protein [Armatimonadota bacterium]MDR5696478.1 exopolysaccharide biosynthesis protein [Armatimonadota bacterium]